MREGAKPAEITDYDLAQKFVGGDQKAFDEIHKRHESRVLNVCRSVTSVSEADDLAQEAWITVYKKIGDFRNESNLATWLYRIALNICLRHIEKNRRETTRDDDFWRSAENLEYLFAPRTLSPEAILEQKLEETTNDERFDKFVATLDADDKVIFINRAQGFEPREIAELLGDRSPQYVSNRFGKLKKKFAEFICDEKSKGGDSKI